MTLRASTLTPPKGKEGVAIGLGRRDPVRRLMPTPLMGHLAVMGRTIRLETNSPAILARTRFILTRQQKPASGHPDFLWKIVCEGHPQTNPPWPELSAYSEPGLRYVSFGQHSFIAIDLEAREAVGYLAEGLLADEAGFASPFLTTLFILTAGSLGLTPLAGACVTMGEKGLLVLGMPNNGKTTSSYLAAKRGLNFYSDRTVFLDTARGKLRVWGDFAPALFRAETAQFLPELQILGRPFRYGDRTYLFVEEGTSIRSNGHPVTPVSCVFLERGGASAPHLTPLDPSEVAHRLAECVSFRDEERFKMQQSRALAALAQIQACRLVYGNDPAGAAPFLRNLLAVCDLLQGNRQALSPCP